MAGAADSGSDRSGETTSGAPRVGAVLLAAGESRRMGQIKALLAWEGRTLIEYQIDQLAASRCAVAFVVLGHAAERLRPFASDRPGLDLKVVENADYGAGKASSIRTGVAALPADLSAILVFAVDQPRPAALIDRLIVERERAGALVAVLAHSGRLGHPPIFAGSLRAELLAIDEATQGLRAVLRRRKSAILAVEVDDPIVHLNLNTPAEYAAGGASRVARRD